MSTSKYLALSKTPYELSNIVYRYCQLQETVQKQTHNYGTGELYTPLEVHTVSLVEEHPGISVTEIAQQTLRTKGAVSQIVTRLEEKGLLRRERNSLNGRQYFLYVTDEGLRLSKLHKEYDNRTFSVWLDDMISLHGLETIEKYFQIMEVSTNNMLQTMYTKTEKDK